MIFQILKTISPQHGSSCSFDNQLCKIVHNLAALRIAHCTKSMFTRF